MTFELTPDRLQQIAVGCVTQFITKQASLNEAIAKEAMDLELNPDQTKRVIEASNTLAYLRQLEKSADRTFEFEVADYNKVLANMTMPDDMLKSAGTPPWLDKDKDKKEDSKEDDKGEEKDKKDKDDAKEKTNKGEDFGRRPGGEKKDEKKESKEEDKGKDKDDEEREDDSEEDKQEKRAMLMRGYFQAKETLEKMAYDEVGIVLELTKAAEALRKDSLALEKIAFVVPSEDFDKTLKLCGIEKRAEQNRILVDQELVQVNYMYGLYKQAEAFLAKKAELENFVSRAEQVLFKQPVDLEKQAYGIIYNGVKSVGGAIGRGAAKIPEAIGYGVGKTVSAIGGGVSNSAKNAYNFRTASSNMGYKNTADAIKGFDKIKATQGSQAAKAAFKGAKPGMLSRVWGKVGIGGVLTATTGASIGHANNVRDLEKD